MRYGTMGVDFEERVNFERLRKERLAKAKAALAASNLGALVCYDFDNIRYITGTHVGEWCRNKMNRYCILPKGGEPLLFDPATPAKKISCPWIADRVFPAVGSMRGAIPPETGSVEKVADDVLKWLKEYGVDKKPVGMDIADIPLIRTLEKRGLEIVDGQEVMLEARITKTKDEIELLKVSAAMVDAAYEEVVRHIRPGNRENDLVAVANHVLYSLDPSWWSASTVWRENGGSLIPTPFRIGSSGRGTWSFWTSCILTWAIARATTGPLSAASPPGNS